MLYRAGNTTLYKEGNGRGLLALSWLWGASTAAVRAMCTAGWQRRYVHAWNCYIILVPISAFWGDKKGAVEEWNVKRHCDCFRNLSQFGIFILSRFVIHFFFNLLARVDQPGVPEGQPCPPESCPYVCDRWAEDTWGSFSQPQRRLLCLDWFPEGW